MKLSLIGFLSFRCTLRIVGTSSHPSIISLGQFQQDSVTSGFVSTVFPRLEVRSNQRGCAGIELRLRNNSLPATGESKELIVNARKVCANSALLPTDGVINIVPGGIIRATIDPERLDGRTARLQLGLRLGPRAVFSEVHRLSKCKPKVTSAEYGGCALWKFKERNELPNSLKKCQDSHSTTISEIEKVLGGRVLLELRNVLAHLLPTSTSNSNWSLVSVFSSITSSSKPSPEHACAGYNTGLDFGLVLSIERFLLAEFPRTTQGSAIASLLDGIWETIAEPPSFLRLPTLTAIDWQVSSYLLIELILFRQWQLGVHLVPEENPELWSSVAPSLSQPPSVSTSKDGRLSANCVGTEQILVKSRSFSGVMNVNVGLQNLHATGGEIVFFQVQEVSRVCSTTPKNPQSIDVVIHSCSSEYPKPMSSESAEPGVIAISAEVVEVVALPFLLFASDGSQFLSSPFVNQQSDISCVPKDATIRHFFHFVSVMIPIRMTPSSPTRSTPACQLLPHKPVFKDLIQTYVSSSVKLDVLIQLSTPQSSRLPQTFEFLLDVALPLAIDDSAVPFHDPNSLPLSVTATLLTDGPLTTRPLVLSRHLNYPVTFQVSSG